MEASQTILKELKAYRDLTNFEKLCRIIQSLSEKEIQLVFEYQRGFTDWLEETILVTQPTISLFEYLVNTPNATESEAAHHLRSRNLKFFRQQVDRLKELIAQAVILPVNYLRENDYSKRHQAHLEVWDRMKLIEMFVGKKNLDGEAYSEMTTVIELGKRFEIFTPLLEALYHKLSFLNLRQATKAFEELKKEIGYYEELRSANIDYEGWKVENKITDTQYPLEQIQFFETPNATRQAVKQLRAYKDLSNFGKLKRTIWVLTVNEKKIALKYLNAFDTRFGDSDTLPELKAAILFKYILETPEATEALAAEYIGEPNIKTFRKLVERLKEKLSQVISLPASYSVGEQWAKRSQAVFEIADRMKRVIFYWGIKNLPGEAYSEICKIIELAKTYEVYFPLLEALYYKRYLISFGPAHELAELKEEIVLYEKSRSAFINAKALFSQYNQFAAMGNKCGYVNQFEKPLEEIARDLNETNSAHVGYFYLMMKIGLYQELGRYDQANEHSLKLLSLVKQSVAVNHPPRMGIAYNFVAESYVHLRKFDEAIAACSTAKAYHTANSINYSVAEELEFFALFYSAKYEKAESKILSLLRNKNYKTSKYLDSCRRFLYACTLFALGKYPECEEELNTITDIQADKEGWNLALRYLSLLLALSRSSEGFYAVHKLDAYRKHIEKLQRKNRVRKRDVTIFKILQEVVRYNYDFEKVYFKREKEFELLSGNHPLFCHKGIIPELIVFQEFFKRRMKRKTYYLDLSLPAYDHLASV